MRLAGIDEMETANAWIADFVTDYNQRFAVPPKDTQDAHIPYQHLQDDLVRTLSVQVPRTLSKNLSCQYAYQLLQITTTGQGLGLRGAKIMVHERFDGKRVAVEKA